jgi:hypothetical protein
MPPLSSPGNFRPGVGRQAGQRQLPFGDLVDQRVVERAELAQRQADVLAHREGAEQAAALEHHAPALAQRQRLPRVERGDVVAEQQHAARARPLQADDLAQQHRLARSAAAGQPEDLAAAHAQVQPVVHGVAAEAGADLLQLDDRGGGRVHLTGPAG